VLRVDTRQRVVAGRYRLLAPLGSGGMGTVWRAEDLVLGREVAVKEVTFPHGLSDADRQVLRERTRREARAAAKLDHPSAVTVYDVVEEDGAPYLVLELVEARTLAEVVREDGPLSPQRTAEVGLALLGALGAAHARGIVHRDVKPSNVMVREDGRVVLTDFGIATATGDSSITHTGLLLGSPAYIAPERARGQAPGPPSDLWSLGATLFTAVEGRPPYDGGEPLLTVTAVVTGEPAPFVAAGPLEPVLAGLLEKDPAQRLDAAAATRMLQPIADRAPVPATRVLAAPAVRTAAHTTALDVGEVREAAQARTAVPLVRPPAREVTRRPGWLVPAAVATTLALVAGGAALALTAGDEEDGRTTAAGPAATAPVAEPTPAQDDDDGQAAAPAAEQRSEEPAQDEPAVEGLPAGWTTETGSAGWTLALPPGYERTRAGEYVGPNRRTLRVDTGKGKDDAVADREAQAADFAKRHPTYEQISIEAVDYRGYEAADWEFTYEGLHVLNRVFVVDGVGHSLFFQTPADDFAAAREDFDGMVAAFQPVGG
jgi:hypothetical protein